MPTHAFYSTAGKPFLVSLERANPGISCEFVIATSGDGTTSAQSSGVQTRWSTQIRQPSLQREESQARQQPSVDISDREMMLDQTDGTVSWGQDRQMSPARTGRSVPVEEDLYGEQDVMMMQQQEEEEEEVPPTQQERYHGIFDD